MAVDKLLGLSLEAAKSNFTRLKKPYKLNFCVTYWCQSRCLTCNIWQMKPKGELSLDEIKEFAKKNNHFRWIGLTGGEPFMRSDIVEVAKVFNENSKGLYVLTIPTNSLCDQTKVVQKIKDILELKIPKVVITLSLDGNKEIHDRVRGVNGNFEKVIGMYKALGELRKDYSNRNLSVVLGYTISKFNQGHFQQTYDDVAKHIPSISYNDFHINIAQLSNNYYRNSEMDLIADKQVVVGELNNILRNRERRFGIMPAIEDAFLKGLIKFAQTGSAPISCRSLDASLFIDSFGNIYPSVMWDRKVANLREIGYDLQNAWQSENANDIREMIEEGTDPVHWTSCEAYQSILGNIFGTKNAVARGIIPAQQSTNSSNSKQREKIAALKLSADER